MLDLIFYQNQEKQGTSLGEYWKIFLWKYETQKIQKIGNTLDLQAFEKTLELIKNTSLNGGKLIFVGNGGSAAIASHMAVDFTKACGIRSVNFNEADLLTCFSNDYG